MHVPQQMQWQDSAACRGMSSLFLSEQLAVAGEHSNSGQTRKILRRAREVCHGCPVKPDCLQHALALPEPYGMWGGLTPRERQRVRRRMTG